MHRDISASGLRGPEPPPEKRAPPDPGKIKGREKAFDARETQSDHTLAQRRKIAHAALKAATGRDMGRGDPASAKARHDAQQAAQRASGVVGVDEAGDVVVMTLDEVSRRCGHSKAWLRDAGLRVIAGRVRQVDWQDFLAERDERAEALAALSGDGWA